MNSESEKMEKVYLFLDESGNVELQEFYDRFSDRYFGMTGVIISFQKSPTAMAYNWLIL